MLLQNRSFVTHSALRTVLGVKLLYPGRIGIWKCPSEMSAKDPDGGLMMALDNPIEGIIQHSARITRNLFYCCLTTKNEQTGLDKKNQPDSCLEVEKIKCEHFIRGLTKPLVLLLFITVRLCTALCWLVRDRNTVSQIWDLPKAENTSNNNAFL